MGGDGFNRVHSIHAGAPWESLLSFASVWFIRSRAGVCNWAHHLGSMGSFAFCLVHSGSFGSFGNVWGWMGSFAFVWLIQLRLVHSGVAWGSLVSFAFVRLHPGVHSCSFVSFGRAMEVDRLICVCLVHSGAHWRSLGSFGFIGFIWAHPGRRWFHSRSFRSFG